MRTRELRLDSDDLTMDEADIDPDGFDPASLVDYLGNDILAMWDNFPRIVYVADDGREIVLKEPPR